MAGEAPHRQSEIEPHWANGTPQPISLPASVLYVTKYARGFQSRRSLLIWKVYGQRLDGLPSEPVSPPPRNESAAPGE